MKLRIVVTALSVIGLTLPSNATSAIPSDWTVSLRRAGPLRFGMSLPQVRQLLGDRGAYLLAPDPNDKSDNGCTYLQTSSVPDGVQLMFDNRRLVSVDISERAAGHTLRGARVGDSEDSVRNLYPGIRIEPHPNQGAGHYLIYAPSDTDRGYLLLFETSGKQVITFRTGLSKAVMFIEGCV